MDRFVYLAANGSEQIKQMQTLQLNNLANVNTAGFRADLSNFKSQAAEGDGLHSRTFTYADDTTSNFSPGSIRQTNRTLDVAITGDGMFAVSGLDGKEAYTRAGNFKISPEGILLTASGQQVLGNGGPISIPPAEKIEIGSDGVISIRPLGQSSESLAQLDRIKLVKPEHADLHKGEDGLFYTAGAPAEEDSSVNVKSGFLEGSNVDAIGTLINIMDYSRQYEMEIKMMKAAEDIASTSEQILQLS